MVLGLVLSYNNDPTLHAVPYHIARELKNYHLLAIRYLFHCFHNKQSGIILNEDHGMNFPLQMVSFLSTFKSDTLGEDPILIITAENNTGLWKQYISDYTEFKTINVSKYDGNCTKTQGLVILGSDAEFKKAVTLKDSEYFMVVVEGLEKVVTMRAFKGIEGVFHVGFTHRNFYKEKDLKLMWQMLKWAEPSAIGKFNDFSEEYNDCILNMIEPFQDIWFRLTWNFSDSFEKPPIEESDSNNTKQRSAEKRRSSTKKRKSSEFNTSTSKKRRSNEFGKSVSTSRKRHSNLLDTSVASSLSTEQSDLSKEHDDTDDDCLPRTPRLQNGDSFGSPSKPRRSLKRMCSESPDQEIECPEVIINAKDSNISPKKETYICNTLKCSPRRRKKRKSTSFTSGSIIGVFEEYYEKNVDTPDTVCENRKSSERQDNEDTSSNSDFSLSLDNSPKTKENNNNSDDNDFESSLANCKDFSSKTKLPNNLPRNDEESEKIKHTINALIKTLNDEDESSNDFSLSLESPPKIIENNCDDNESSVTDFSLSLELSPPKTKQSDVLVSTQTKQTPNESSDDFFLLVNNKNDNSHDLLNETKITVATTYEKTNLQLSKLEEDISHNNSQILTQNTSSKLHIFSNEPSTATKHSNNDSEIAYKDNSSKCYSVHNNEPSTSTKNFEPVKTKNITEKNNKDAQSNRENLLMKKGKTFGKHKSANAIMEKYIETQPLNSDVELNKEGKIVSKNKLEENTQLSNSNVKLKGKILSKHKSATAIVEKITDDVLVKEFSSDFFSSSQETQTFFRKTQSDTNLNKKIKVIDKHVLEEFAKDFPLPKTSLGDGLCILNNVRNFFDNEAGTSNQENSVAWESPENIWSLFRKGDVKISNKSIEDKILPDAENITPSIKSVYSQDTQIIDKQDGECMDCSGEDGKVVEYCVKCRKTVTKEDKSTQSDFDEMSKSDDIFAIFNSCDTPDIIAGGVRKIDCRVRSDEKISLASFFGEEKKTIRKRHSREDVLSSIFDGGDNEDKDDDFNDLDLWSVSIGEEKTKRVQSEILQTLFGD